MGPTASPASSATCPVEMDGPRCGCGGIGHVEAIAAGVSLAREARALRRGDALALPRRAAERACGGADELSAKDVAEGALAGDPACVAVMDRARRALAAACVGYVNTFNPHRIVIGGAIAEAEGERLLEPIREAIASEAFEVVARHVSRRPRGARGRRLARRRAAARDASPGGSRTVDAPMAHRAA